MPTRQRFHPRGGKQLGRVAHLQRDPQVGLVGAIPFHRPFIGNALERRGGAAPLGAQLGEKAVQYVLDDLEDVLLLHKAHLEVELVELSRRTVGAGVLVAITGGDLEIAVEARDHEELLELLGSLRQGVELARVQARWNEVIASALGARSREGGSLDLEEVVTPHALAYARDDLGAQNDVLVHASTTEVEEAVAKPSLLGSVLVGKDRERQLSRRAKNRDLCCLDLDLTGLEQSVHRFRRTRQNAALHLQDGLLGSVREVQAGLGPNHYLSDAVVIAQVEKQKATEVATRVQPSAQDDVLPHVLAAQRTAGMGAHARREGVIGLGFVCHSRQF